MKILKRIHDFTMTTIVICWLPICGFFVVVELIDLISWFVWFICLCEHILHRSYNDGNSHSNRKLISHNDGNSNNNGKHIELCINYILIACY